MLHSGASLCTSASQESNKSLTPVKLDSSQLPLRLVHDLAPFLQQGEIISPRIRKNLILAHPIQRRSQMRFHSQGNELCFAIKYTQTLDFNLQAPEPVEGLLKCCILAQEDTMTRRNKFYFYQELALGRTFQNKLLMTAEFWPQRY